MAESKNDQDKTAGSDKRPGAPESTASRVSAGTSVGNIGQPPTPHASEGSKPAQSATLASHTSKPLGGGQGADKDRSRDASPVRDQAEALTQRAQQASSEVSSRIREAAGDVREKAGEAYEEASEWAQDTYDRVSHWASDTYDERGEHLRDLRHRSAQRLGQVRGGVQSYVSENPMVVGLVGLAAGLLLGALLPRTRRENETFGRWADEVRDQGVRYAREAAHMGREYVEEAFNGEDPRFSKHESEFRSEQPGSNRH